MTLGTVAVGGSYGWRVGGRRGERRGERRGDTYLNRRSNIELILIFLICLSVTTHVFQKCNGTRGSGWNNGGNGRRPGVVHYLGVCANETLLDAYVFRVLYLDTPMTHN
jgi:hypothetical protein